MKEVIPANTGSSVKIIAVCDGVVCCCAQTCAEKAMAVATTPVTRTAVTSPGVQATRAGSHRVTTSSGTLTKVSSAVIAICSSVSAPAGYRGA